MAMSLGMQNCSAVDPENGPLPSMFFFGKDSMTHSDKALMRTDFFLSAHVDIHVCVYTYIMTIENMCTERDTNCSKHRQTD